MVGWVRPAVMSCDVKQGPRALTSMALSYSELSRRVTLNGAVLDRLPVFCGDLAILPGVVLSEASSRWSSRSLLSWSFYDRREQ